MKNNIFFEVVKCRLLADTNGSEKATQETVVKIRKGEKQIHTAFESDSAIKSLYSALKKGVEVFYPEVSSARLVEYSEFYNNDTIKTEIISTDCRGKKWTAVGVSSNDLDARIQAVVKSLVHKIEKQ